MYKIPGLPLGEAYILKEIDKMRAKVEERRTNQMSKKAQLKKLLQKGTRNPIGIGLALMFLQSFTGPTTFPACFNPSALEEYPLNALLRASTASAKVLA
ncbi:hypothetical protein P280DRAFT_523055 [Massarina eburnea CBS 473.64]|uniref:Uncharacterized protein n=1 Tax=Massarina eburnea CBS 473.64 TaxID=1395130 RepID=A0A6A6RJJ6_9PLEO|nr:hypothetical protein P280DRAFT_523055 [Massarina eburnea CBS 473.64]